MNSFYVNKKWYQFFSLFLCIIMALQPCSIQKAEAADNVTLDIANGNITVAGMDYTQKDSSSTVVASGTVPDGAELILTGVQTSSYAVKFSGSTHPTVRLKNITTNSTFTGSSVTGTLNFIVDGSCTFGNGFITASSGFTSLTSLNITGENDAILKGAFSTKYITSGTVTFSNLTFYGGDTTTYITISSIANVVINNCVQYDAEMISVSTTGGTTISDSEFQYLSVNSVGTLLIDNTTIEDGDNLLCGYQSMATSCTIVDSYIKTAGVYFNSYATTIQNSYIYSDGPYNGKGLFVVSGTTKVIGSTLEDVSDSSTVYKDMYISGGTYKVFSTDSAFIFKAPITEDKIRFYQTDGVGETDPYDESGNPLYLNKVLVPDAESSQVTVSIDGRDSVNLWTDDEGYLFLYLTTGSHEVAVTDTDGRNYSLVFTGATTRETVTNSNIAGTAEELGDPVTITFSPYANTDIEYSFDKSTWYDTTTDDNCEFSVVFPDDAATIYVRLVSTGEIKYADIEDGAVGVWQDAKPLITSQSNSDVTLVKGTEGTLYVEAVPFESGNILTYQWFKDGDSMSGMTDNILTIPDVEEADAGTYTCIVTESDGKINVSDTITVTVVDPADAEELSAQIADLTSQVEELQAAFEEAGEEKEELQATVTLLQNQIADLNNQITSLQNQISNLDEQLAESDADKEALNDSISTLNDQIEELTQDKGDLEDELETAQDEITELQENLNTLAEEKTTLANQLSEISQQLEEAEGENAELTAEISGLNDRITELSNIIIELNNSLVELNENNAELQEQLEDATTEINSLTSLLILIKSELGVSEDGDILSAIQELKDQLEEEEAQNSELLEVIADLEEKLSDATASNKELNDKLNDIISLVGAEGDEDVLDKITELQEALSSSENQITELEQEKQQYLSQLEEANEKITSLQAQLEALLNSGDDTEDELREQIVLLMEQITQLKADNETLSVSLTNLNIQVSDLTDEKVELEAEIASLESLLATANSTIEELRQQVADLTAKNTILQSNNDTLQEENNSLVSENTSLEEEIMVLNGKIADGETTDTEIENLKQQLAAVEAELAETEEELEEAEDASSTNSSNASNDSLPENSVIVTTAEETQTDNVIDSGESETVVGGTIVADDGWELAANLTDDYTSSLNITDSYVSVYSFYDESMNSVSQLSTNKQGTIQVLALSDESYSDADNETTDQNGYVKYTFYARRIANPSKIYECSIDVKKSDYVTPVTTLTSSVKEIVNNYAVSNTYDVEVDAGATFYVDADFGSYGRKEILYQLVPAEEDFDPDGSWKVVEGNTITLKKVTEAGRLYVKYVDNGNNYTVDKTVGFKPASEQEAEQSDTAVITNPTFQMNKTIYLGYQYQVQLADFEKKSKITYSSSDEEVATVDEEGVITAISKGKATIYGKVAQGDNTYQYVIQVTVADGGGQPTLNLITTNVSTTGDNPVLILYKQVKKDAKTQLEISGLAEDAIITYLTSDSKTVTVTKDGTITGVKKGSAVITVLLTQGGKHYIYLVKVRVDDGTKDEEMYEYLE